MAHRTWYHWPYEQHLHVQVNDADVPSGSVQVEQVEQQFDFRQIDVSSRSVKIERLDMMRSPRQWTTALRVTNLLSAPAKIAVEFEWTGQGQSSARGAAMVGSGGKGVRVFDCRWAAHPRGPRVRRNLGKERRYCGR